MDPETGLDAVRNVGIARGKIVRTDQGRLSGTRVLSARGLVVAPGFIDLDQHLQDNESGRRKALDGVTTALGMENRRARCRQVPAEQAWPLTDQLRHLGRSPRRAKQRHALCDRQRGGLGRRRGDRGTTFPGRALLPGGLRSGRVAAEPPL